MPNALHIGTLGKPHGIKGANVIFSKTIPENIIFHLTLFFNVDESFEISKYEIHHNKTICFSDKIPNRNIAEQSMGLKLYCQKDLFLEQHPDQVYDDICQGYQIHDCHKQYIGELQRLATISDLLCLIVVDKNQTYHLAYKPKHIDHQKQVIQLEYSL